MPELQIAMRDPKVEPYPRHPSLWRLRCAHSARHREDQVREDDFLGGGQTLRAVGPDPPMPWKCRKSARRIRSTFADQFKGDTEKACVFFRRRQTAADQTFNVGPRVELPFGAQSGRGRRPLRSDETKLCRFRPASTCRGDRSSRRRRACAMYPRRCLHKPVPRFQP
jgi:hypothetical protein